MTSAVAAPPASRGAQEPRVCHVPPFVSSTGAEAVELARMAGLEPDPWQEFVVHRGLAEREDGKWAAFEIGLEVPRQNGKGTVLEIRELAGLFLLRDELTIHSAHEFATAEEALERMAAIIEGCPDLSRRVKTIKRSHGQEGIYLMNGQRLRYKTRTKGGGRGFTADCVILDEAMVIPESFLGALMPTLSARPNPQLWYTGSAVDQESMEHGVVFSRVRDRGLEGKDPSLAYFGWSAPFKSPVDVPDEAAGDPEAWADANPGLGIRISVEHVAKEQRSMDARTFAVERLGVGDWPEVDEDGADVLDLDAFRALEDPVSGIVGAPVFAFDVRPDRSYSTIGAAGKRSDGVAHAEVVDRHAGTKWLVPRLVELKETHGAAGIVCDGKSPAAALIPKCEEAGLQVDVLEASEYAQACGRLVDGVNDAAFRHLGTQELYSAAKGAAKRPLGDAWAWSRKSSSVDISPLVVITLALWALEGPSLEPLFGFA